MTKVVVDVGALTHAGGESSVEVLVDRFDPELLFAFDPLPGFEEGVYRVGEICTVVHRRLAAWTFSGAIDFLSDTTASRIASQTEGTIIVQAFDLPGWLSTLPAGAVLKLDCEGAEHVLLRSLYWQGLDARLERILVEWHGAPLDLPFRCPVEAWTL